jgi:hypothetical protein
MADTRTVLDMLVEADLATHIFVASDGINSISVHTDEQAATRAVEALGVDPDMPFDQFEVVSPALRRLIDQVIEIRYGPTGGPFALAGLVDDYVLERRLAIKGDD